MFSQVKLIGAGIILAIILGTGTYINILQNSNDAKDAIIESQRVEVIVDQKSDAAHALTSELALDMAVAKGGSNEVEINTSVGIHTYSFDRVLSQF